MWPLVWSAAGLTQEPRPTGKPSERRAGEAAAEWRRYSDGPLTTADFRGNPSAEDAAAVGTRYGPLTAFTSTELRYEIRFQGVKARNRWTARLQSLDAFAVVLRNRSWNQRPDDRQLLDHEQGHFDLTQGYALAVQGHYQQQRKSGRLPVGTGTTSAEAVRNLEDRVRAELKPILDEHTQSHGEYDRVTRHGTMAIPQAEQRQKQLARIAEYREKLESVK